jgi:hypothetical protein
MFMQIVCLKIESFQISADEMVDYIDIVFHKTMESYEFLITCHMKSIEKCKEYSGRPLHDILSTFFATYFKKEENINTYRRMARILMDCTEETSGLHPKQMPLMGEP